MGQTFFQDNIPLAVKASGTSITLAATQNSQPTRITLGGQQYALTTTLTFSSGVSGIGGIDTGSLAAGTIYNLFAVISSGGILGLVSSTGLTPTGFAAYKFLGKWISSSVPDVSHMMNVGERFVQYVYNSGTWDADDETSFGYGVNGQTVTQNTNLTTRRTRRCKSLTTIKDTDILTLQWQIRGLWEDSPAAYFPDTGYPVDAIRLGSATTNAEGIGAGIQTITGQSTDFYHSTGHYATAYMVNSAAEPATFTQTKIGWAAAISTFVVKWRVRILSDVITGP